MAGGRPPAAGGRFVRRALSKTKDHYIRTGADTGVVMTNPFAGHLSDSAGHYVARIGSLYDRAVSLVKGSSADQAALRTWEWHRASARACTEEAAHLYVAGLEALLKRPLTVRCADRRGKPEFICLMEDEGTQHSFRFLGRELCADGDGEQEAVVEAFGHEDTAVLAAFAEGLCELRHLGSFRRPRELKLQPDPPSSYR